MVSTRGARSPASTAISRSKLRMSRPAPARSTKASATLETTSVACSRCRRAPEVLRDPPSRSSSVRSRRSLAASGSRPKTTAVSADSANVNRTTRASSVTSETPGRLRAITAGIARTAAYPRNRPSAPPVAVEQESFDEQHLEQAAASGADRRAHGHLALARDGAAQDEVRDVRTRDEQHEADRAEQEQQRPLHLAGDLLGERHRGEGERLHRLPQQGGIVLDET